jgi:hypothetical protein
VQVYREPTGWSWRHRASNGWAISSCCRPYPRLRDIARSLERAFPGYRLLDQAGCLIGPDWFLWGLEAAWQDGDGSAYLALPPGMQLGIGIRGVRIPVLVPDGVNLSSRR